MSSIHLVELKNSAGTSITSTTDADKVQLDVAVNDYAIEVVAGNITGHKVVTLFGRNPDIDIADGFETIWNGGGIYTGMNATAAETVQVFSSDANDTSAGTGARTIKVYGLALDGTEQSETVTLNGTTPVDTVNTYYRMTYGEVKSVGSGQVNAGTITARQKTTTANIFFNMPIAYNHTAILAYTVPKGKIGLIKCYSAFVLSKGVSNSEIRMWIREPNDVWRVEDMGACSDKRNLEKKWEYFFDAKLPALTDIRINADTDANNTVMGGSLCLILINA